MFKRLAAISVPAFIIIMATLAIMDIGGTFEPPLLLPILNTLFISVMSFAVAYVAARSYGTSGSLSLLLMGCGTLSFGAANLVAGWLIGPVGGSNVNVTIHNTGALFGSTFHVASAVLALTGVTSEKVLKLGKLKVIFAYLGVLVLTTLVTIASLQDAIPPFFIQGVGPTLLRQVVLGTSVALFAISSYLFMGLYSQSKTDLLYWYSLALAMITVGLTAVFLQNTVGSPLGWAGRFAQYLGGIYFLVFVLTSIRGARTKGIPLEKGVAGFFSQPRAHHRLPGGLIGVLIFVITISSLIAWYISRHSVTVPLSFPEQRIVVGCTDNFPPFDLRDKNGDHIGYARDISTAVAEELGVDIEYRTSSRWVEVVEWLKNGEIDLIHLIAYSPERDEYFDFTIPHTLVPEVIFVRSERLDIHGLDDLGGKQIGAVREHITHERLLSYKNLNIMVFETPREGIEALLDGKVDAFAYPEFVFEYLVQQMGREDEVKIVGEPLGHLRYGMAVREGDYVLLSYLDRAIQRIEASGQRDEIAQRWFGRDVFLGLTREEVLNLVGWTVFGLLVTSLGGSAYISVRYRLRKAEAVLRHNLVFQFVDDSVILTSLDGKITDWNPGAERTFGYTREEILGRRLDFLLAPEGSTEPFETIIREVQAEGIWSGEFRTVRKDDSQVVCSITVTALWNEKGDIIAYTSIIRDITKRVQAEQEIESVNRELRALSDCNQVVIRARDEVRLMNDICRIIVDVGGYRLAWVGFAEQNEMKTVRPVAQFGFEQDYLDTLDLTWADVERGRGPTGTSIRSGMPYVLRNMQTDPRFKPWRTEAIKRGYHSSIALPMTDNGWIFGALNIYSSELDAFNDGEVKLLTELADNLTFGIKSLRTRAKRKQAEAALTRHASELEALYQSSLAFSQLLEPEAVGEQIVATLEHLLEYQRCAIVVRNDDSGELQLLAHARMGMDEETYQAELMRVRALLQSNRGFTRWVAEHGEPLRHGDVQSDSRYINAEPAIRSEMAVPLKVGGRTIGAINVESTHPDAFSDYDERLLITLANLAAVAIENAQLYAQVQDGLDQLRDLAHYLQNAREEERTYISREIHDEFGQALTALKMDLIWISKRLPPDTQVLKEKVSTMSKLVDDTIHMMQCIATELRPGLLDDLGLMAALEWQTQEFAVRSGISCELHLPEEEITLDRDLGTTVFRIFQETLTNIARHSEATKVQVELEVDPGEVMLTIRDNGVGITDDELSGSSSLGLIGMRERARSMGGEITFQGVSGQGTTVAVRIPRSTKKGSQK